MDRPPCKATTHILCAYDMIYTHNELRMMRWLSHGLHVTHRSPFLLCFFCLIRSEGGPQQRAANEEGDDEDDEDDDDAEAKVGQA